MGLIPIGGLFEWKPAAIAAQQLIARDAKFGEFIWV